MNARDNRTIVNQWLSHLSEEFSLDEDGTCNLVDENMECMIQIVEGSDMFHLSTPLMPLPEENQLDFMTQLLVLNMYQLETCGAALALDPMNLHVTFCYTRELEDLNETTFGNVLENFMATAGTLLEQLSAPITGIGSEAQKTAPPNLETASSPAYIVP